MEKLKSIFKDIAFILTALCIPALLAVQSLQAHRYMGLENQLKRLQLMKGDKVI